MPRLPGWLKLLQYKYVLGRKMEERIAKFSPLWGIATRIGFVVRFYQWLSYFRVTEEAENASCCFACIFGLAWATFWPVMNSLSDLLFGFSLDIDWPSMAQGILLGQSNLVADLDIASQGWVKNAEEILQMSSEEILQKIREAEGDGTDSMKAN